MICFPCSNSLDFFVLSLSFLYLISILDLLYSVPLQGIAIVLFWHIVSFAFLRYEFLREFG